ncbi:hypothetical protein RND71_005468 [Anisodus tanguticus]|uniref:Hexosyltransferase n=1 Tax=Anisodus tanguticus TaxID=243964 RepID=A0AAE1SS71_9SOLA|nr:hypothetical protein RND71_005468 [Anisodus tanguticus]
MDEINNAAVVHFNGNMKPWLDIAMNQFRTLWSKYVDKENEYLLSILVTVESMLDGVNKLVLQASPVWLVTSPSHVKLVLNFNFFTSILVLAFFFFYFSLVF